MSAKLNKGEKREQRKMTRSAKQERKRLTFEQAYTLMPACLVGATDRPTTIEDLRAAAEHEVDMFNERQDGCLSCQEMQQVRYFLAVTSNSIRSLEDK
jgi:hypothetical protein